MQENKGKYDIDELVNSLLMERQPVLLKEEPQLNTTDIDPEDNPYIMEVSEDMATDAEEELIDEPSQLLPYEDIDAFSVAEVDAEVRQADEHFISRLIETTEALPPVVEFTPEPVIEEEPVISPYVRSGFCRSKSRRDT